MGQSTRKANKLGSILVWVLMAFALLVVMLGVLRLAEWVVQETFHEEQSSTSPSVETAIQNQRFSPGHYNGQAGPIE